LNLSFFSKSTFLFQVVVSLDELNKFRPFSPPGPGPQPPPRPLHPLHPEEPSQSQPPPPPPPYPTASPSSPVFPPQPPVPNYRCSESPVYKCLRSDPLPLSEKKPEESHFDASRSLSYSSPSISTEDRPDLVVTDELVPVDGKTKLVAGSDLTVFFHIKNDTTEDWPTKTHLCIINLSKPEIIDTDRNVVIPFVNDNKGKELLFGVRFKVPNVPGPSNVFLVLVNEGQRFGNMLFSFKFEVVVRDEMFVSPDIVRKLERKLKENDFQFENSSYHSYGY